MTYRRQFAVIGNTFVDCKGLADGENGKYLEEGRNIGRIQTI